MQKHYENFLTTLYRFIQDLDRYNQTDGTKQILAIFNKLDMARIIFRVYTLLKGAAVQINSKDDTLFNTPFEILPTVNISSYWPNLVSGRKDKIWTYLAILQIESDILVNQPKEQQVPQESTTELPTQPQEFDPYVGVGGNVNGQEYGVEQMYASLANMPDEGSSNGAGPGLASIAKLIGLDKMVNFAELSEQLQNMKPEDIESATNNIKEMLGNNIDDKTTSVLNGMLTDISVEMKSANLGGGDPFKNIMDVAEKVAGNMRPKIQSGELDIGKLVNSTQLFATQCKDKDGKPMFSEGNNPFAMLSQLAASMTGGGGNNMSEQQMKSQCNDMLKSMGMDTNVEQLMGQQVNKNKKKNKNKNRK